MGSVLAAEPARDWVALLDADASLASAIAPATLAAALPACVAPVFGLDPGPWQPPRDLVGPGGLGLLVLEGFLVRQVDVVGRPATELLGAGDLLRPWQPDRTAPFSSGARWQVCRCTTRRSTTATRPTRTGCGCRAFAPTTATAP